MRVTDPQTGREFFAKRRRRFDKDRMPRELTFSCFQRMPLLNRDRTRRWFIESLEETRREWPIDLWAWVIMPEHVHLLIAPRESRMAIGRFQGLVKERTARRAIAWLEENAPTWITRITVREGNRVRRRFWQPGGGDDRNINQVETLYHSLNYIHMNPVKRGLVAQAEDWEWSSARWYSGHGQPLIEMDATLPAPSR